MSEKDHLLAIDNGTQSVRALLFDLQGNLVDKVQVPLEPYYSTHPGWAEQDPLYYWRSLCEACQKLWQQSRVPKEAVAGVALTTQRASLINVDTQGRPLRPAIIWLDQRRAEGLKPVGGILGLVLRLIRMNNLVAHFRAEAESNWINMHQPDIWAGLGEGKR